MSTEETREELEREAKIPLYFNRYVASELRALGQRIVDLKAIMDERLAHIEARFTQVDRRFDESREEINMRFEEVNQRFDGVNQRFEEINQRFDGVNQRFDKLESTLKWAVGLLASLFVPVIVGILAIIIKMFFAGKISP